MLAARLVEAGNRLKTPVGTDRRMRLREPARR
jgi:hypothetical protein